MATAKKVIGFTELKEKYILQRYPMIMLDRVTDYEPGKYMHAIKAVTGNSPELVSHFPEKRCFMPGTAVIQAFSQLGIVFFLVSTGPLEKDELTVVSSTKAKFLRMIFPGDTMHLTITPRRLNRTVGIFNVDVKVDGTSVVRGSLTLARTTETRFPNAPW